MGSFGVDIDLRFNTASALKDYKEFTAKAKEMMKEVAAGVEGSEKKLEKLQGDFARSMISNTTRQGRALESSIKSLERQAELAGKTYSQQLLLRQEKWVKALGEDEKAVKRVTAAFQQLIKTEEEEDRKRKSHGSNASLLFRGARDVFEGRLTYGVMDFGRAGLNMMRSSGAGAGAGAEGGVAAAFGKTFGGGAAASGALAGISSTALAVGGLATGFLALEAAGAHAAKSMGDYGEHLREIQTITGMTVREVQQLEIAAKMSGHTIEDITGGMRGLTQALQGTGSTAVKASKDLQKMGVDVVGIRLGVVGTYEALEQIGEAAKNNGDAFESNLEMMDLFKKAGLNMKYTLGELAKAKEVSSQLPLFTEEEVKQMDKMDERFDKLGATTDAYFKRLKFWLAQRFTADIELIVKVTNAAGKVINPILKANDATATFNEGILRDLGIMDFDRPQLVTKTLPGTSGSDVIKQHLESRSAQFKQMMADQGTSNLEGAESKLRDLEKERHDMLEDTVKNEGDFVRSRETYLDHLTKVTAEMEKQKTLVEKMRQDESDRKNIIEALRREGVEAEQARESPFTLPAQAALNRNLRMRGVTPEQKAEFERLAADRIAFENKEQAAKFRNQMLEAQQNVTRQMDRAHLGGVMPVNIRQLGVGGVTRADVVSDLDAQEQQRRDSAMETFRKEDALIRARKIDAADSNALAKQQQDIVANTGRLATAQVEAEMAKKREMYALDQHERDLARQHRETMSRIELADQEESIKHDADLARKRAELRFKGENPAAGIAESYRISVQLAQDLYDQEIRRIDAVEYGDKAKEDRAIALHKLHRDDEQASEDAQFKLAEMQQQQLDHLKSTIEPLYHTLFTDPSKFGSQLRSTLQEAALKPITSGLSQMTATALHPLIYGAGGTGGIAGGFAGIFGGGHKLSDLTLLPDKSMPVTIVADQTGGGGGGGGDSVFGGGGGGEYKEQIGLAGRSGGIGRLFRKYLVNPPGADDAMLAEIRKRESSGNYTAQNKSSSASGAYQFIDSTWREAAQATGIGTGFKRAKDAPPFIQDVNARYLLNKFGPNSTASWAASGPYGVPGGVPSGGGGGGGIEADLTGDMPRFSTTAWGHADVDTVSSGMASSLTGVGYEGLPVDAGGYGRGGAGGGTVAGNLASVLLSSALGGGGTSSGGRGLNLGGITGGFRGMLQGWRNLLGQSKPAVFGETPGQESLNRVGATGTGGFSMKGLANSPLAKAGAGTVGMMLAQEGLFGNSRGTGMGVLEGTLGGAGVGFSIGGPIGAAVGAGIGLGIGLGEVIAGVESPRNEAKRLVQSIYHIGINSTTADQIVNMANQSYGGHVSLAVRSPEVRHMLGLYAAGTGQGSIFANSANEARGASLVQSGGTLSQQATYQYGQAFSQSSNLPIYGGASTHVIGAPGGSMNLSLNIGGQDAAKFMTGNVVTPEVVQTQYASAMYGSAGRVPQALMMSEPGAIAS